MLLRRCILLVLPALVAPNTEVPKEGGMAGCTYEFGIDYFQPAAPSIKADTAEDCAKLCSVSASCTHFSHGRGLCYFKGGSDGRRADGEMVSGWCSAESAVAQAAQAWLWRLEPGTDYFQPNAPSAKASSIFDCVAQCQQRDGCSHFSFAWGACWFKSSSDGARTNRFIVSGSLQAPAGAPGGGATRAPTEAPTSVNPTSTGTITSTASTLTSGSTSTSTSPIQR